MESTLPTILISAATTLVVISFQELLARDIPKALFQPCHDRLEAAVYAWAWHWRIPKGYQDRARLVQLRQGRRITVLGHEYRIAGLTEYDSKGERFFEFGLAASHNEEPCRWILFSGEDCTFWACWEDQAFWKAHDVPYVPKPLAISMPYIERSLQEDPVSSLTLPRGDGSGSIEVELTDVRRGSRTTNLFGGTLDMSAPYVRESKGVTGRIKGLKARVDGEQCSVLVALYEYGDNELLDDLFVGIPITPMTDMGPVPTGSIGKERTRCVE